MSQSFPQYLDVEGKPAIRESENRLPMLQTPDGPIVLDAKRYGTEAVEIDKEEYDRLMKALTDRKK